MLDFDRISLNFIAFGVFDDFHRPAAVRPAVQELPERRWRVYRPGELRRVFFQPGAHRLDLEQLRHLDAAHLGNPTDVVTQ